MFNKLYRYTKLDTEGTEGQDYDSDSEQSAQQHGRRAGFTPSKRRTRYTSIILATLNVFLLAMWLRAEYMYRRGTSSQQASKDCVRPQITYSTAREDGAIEYERRRLWRPLEDNPYTGLPRPEHDQAWRKLIEPLTTLLTPAEYEAADLGSPTLAFKDGSGYIGELSVYHELHCIRRVRRFLYLDHYNPNMTALERQLETLHIDHCLEYFREAAMCRADSTVATYFWRDGLPTSRVHSDHECVNWDKFDTWARGRMLFISDPTVLDETDRWTYVRTSTGKTALSDSPDVEAHP